MPTKMDRRQPGWEGVPYLPASTDQDPRASPSSENPNLHHHLDAAKDDAGNSERSSNSAKLSKRGKLHLLTSKTKAKTKALLHLDDSETLTVEADREDGGALSIIQNDPAFHPTRVIEEAGSQLGEQRGGVDKAVDRMKNLGTTIAHPRTAIKAKATKTTAVGLSASHPPQLSHGVDQQLLELHDDLARAEWRSSRVTTSEEEANGDAEVDERKEKIRKMEEYRESVRVAWATKHIDRVRVVPQALVRKPYREAFVERDEKGEVARTRWGEWLGQFVLYHTQDFSVQYIDDFDELPFDIDRLRDHIERIVVASAPWQKWFMQVRKVYRWEDPKRTAMWLAVYVTCWYYQFFLGFVYGYIIYRVLRNRYFPTSLQSLRESNQRATAEEGTAYHLGELMHKHGREGWLEPLVEELGPYVQLEAGDLADLLEVFAKYVTISPIFLQKKETPLYPLFHPTLPPSFSPPPPPPSFPSPSPHHRPPSLLTRTHHPTSFATWNLPLKTAQTLFFFATCLLISLLTDMAFSMKVFWFLAGGAFFLSWPISSHYPKYRHLVSPLRWVFWDIPTEAERAFLYLRARAQGARERVLERALERAVSVEQTSAGGAYADDGAASAIGGPPGIAAGGERDDVEVEDWHTPPSTPSPPSDPTLLAFRAHYQSHQGKLLLSTNGVRFVRTSHLHAHRATREPFALPYTHLREMRKIDGTMSRLAKVSGVLPKRVKESGEDLLFLGAEGEVLVESVADRDEAFNAVVGFSGLRWQKLQGGGERGKGGEGKGKGKGKGGLWGQWGTMGIG